MKILMIGATGTVGRVVLSDLLKRKCSVKALVRRQPSSLPENVEIAVGDLTDPPSIQRALEGVNKLYLLNAVSADELNQGLIAVGLAIKAKVEHIVYHSVFQAERFPLVPHFASKVMIESAILDSGVPYTILRPSYFYQNDLALKDALIDRAVYRVPLGVTGISMVDVRDIADATATVLSHRGYENKVFNVVGPQALSGPEVARIWSRVLHRDVQYTGTDLDVFEANMRKEVPPWLAYDLRMMFEAYWRHGFREAYEDIVELTRLLGHPPRSYEAFARETAATWLQTQRAA